MALAPDPDARARREQLFADAGGLSDYLCARVGDTHLLVRSDDQHVGRALFVKGGRGDAGVLSRSVAVIRTLLGDDAIIDRTFIDVGANIGSTTVPALLTHAFAEALALEPEPQNAMTLRLNVLLNRVQDRCRVLEVAASDAVGRVDLVVRDGRSGKHFVAPEAPRKLRRTEHVVGVEATTLDRLAADGVYAPERTGLLWIDAEAHEPAILAGAGALTGRGTPVLFECDPKGLGEAGTAPALGALLARDYTHFAAMRADRDSGDGFTLLPTAEFPAFLDRLERFTDVLALRLPEHRVPTESLAAAVRRRGARIRDDG